MMDFIIKHSQTFLIIMETHIGFYKTKSLWDRVGSVTVHYVDVCDQYEGIWMLKHNGSNIVTGTMMSLWIQLLLNYHWELPFGM